MDENTFRALARSSPWLWSSLRLTRTVAGREAGTVRAWIHRPGRMRVEEPDGQVYTVDEAARRGDDRVVADVPGDGDPDARPAALPPRPEFCFPLDPWAPQPLRRPDGLVAERPDGGELVHDDPMYENYRWVAMLDPVELADGTPADGPAHDPSVRAVEVVELAAVTRAGRATVEATVRPTDAYDPRCSCCPLLMSEVVAGILREEGGPVPERAFPEAFRVALDVATGVVVSLRDLGGDEDGAGFDVTLDAVELVPRRGSDPGGYS